MLVEAGREVEGRWRFMRMGMVECERCGGGGGGEG